MSQPLETRLTPDVVESLFPEAESLGPVQGEPPLATVFAGGEAIGTLFSTHETVHPAGYEGLSFDIIVALGADGVIRGHRVLEEHEPLISDRMVSVDDLNGFLDRNHGLDIRSRHRQLPSDADGVSGATISAMTMSNAIMDSAILVGYVTGILDDSGTGLTLDRVSFEARDWEALLADGSVKALTVSNGEVRAALGAAAPTDLGADDAPFLTLYAALATPPGIGRNLFGIRVFRSALQSSQAGDHHLLIASHGAGRWIPRNPYMADEFEHIRIVQGERALALRTENFYRTRALAIAGHPRFDQAARFHIPAESGFDALAPWQLEIDVPGTGDGAVASFALAYRIPSAYVLGEAAALEDAGFRTPNFVAFGLWRESTLSPWQRAWVDKGWTLAAIAALLAAVTAVMLFQRRLVRARRWHRAVRLAILAVTLVGLGWIAGAQLTIVTVLTWLRMAFIGLDWRAFLMDAPLVLLSAYVLVTLLLWGRGVFCGWLCPFGALQELLNTLARLIRIPQLPVPEPLQRRLWALKYVIALGLAGLAVVSLETADAAAEIEPFKTAISLRFQRAGPYLLWAGALLAVGLFVERFFCRFLCPLGAVLALAGRFPLFSWLKRRPECGSPCHICATACPIGAIRGNGSIVVSECLQCLDCQVEYHDDRRCPPLAAQRKHLDALAAE